MSENRDAQQVIRSEKERDFQKLFKRLTERFEMNAEVEKERLMDDFQKACRTTGESLRAYYGRLYSMVAELRNVYSREVPDEDLVRALKKELSETSKNNLVQLSKLPEYKGATNDLCLEVVRRDEELDQKKGGRFVISEVSAHNVMDNGFRGLCNLCKRRGHKAKYC